MGIILNILLVLFLVFAATGCPDNDGPVENAGESVDRAVEDAGDAVERATDPD